MSFSWLCYLCTRSQCGFGGDQEKLRDISLSKELEDPRIVSSSEMWENLWQSWWKLPLNPCLSLTTFSLESSPFIITGRKFTVLVSFIIILTSLVKISLFSHTHMLILSFVDIYYIVLILDMVLVYSRNSKMSKNAFGLMNFFFLDPFELCLCSWNNVSFASFMIFLPEFRDFSFFKDSFPKLRCFFLQPFQLFKDSFPELSQFKSLIRLTFSIGKESIAFTCNLHEGL